MSPVIFIFSCYIAMLSHVVLYVVLICNLANRNAQYLTFIVDVS